jgi:RNA binding exosome subunit
MLTGVVLALIAIIAFKAWMWWPQGHYWLAMTVIAERQRREVKGIAKRVASIVEGVRTRLAASIRRRIAEHKRRIEHEHEFYRRFNAYCREHDLAPLCEDDWKSYRYYDCDRPT